MENAIECCLSNFYEPVAPFDGYLYSLYCCARYVLMEIWLFAIKCDKLWAPFVYGLNTEYMFYFFHILADMISHFILIQWKFPQSGRKCFWIDCDFVELRFLNSMLSTWSHLSKEFPLILIHKIFIYIALLFIVYCIILCVFISMFNSYSFIELFHANPFR